MNVKLDGLTLHVEPDYNPPHPRTECDHLGKMLCWHRNYTFGNQNRYNTPEDFYRSEEAKNIYVSLPVYILSIARKKPQKNGSGICPTKKC